MGRWRFVDESIASERAARDRTVALIDAWWDTFGARTDDLSALFRRQQQWDLPGWMADHLQAVDPRPMWEYGPAVRAEGHRLVITPESAHHLRPLAATPLERAPAIPGWVGVLRVTGCEPGDGRGLGRAARPVLTGFAAAAAG